MEGKDKATVAAATKKRKKGVTDGTWVAEHEALFRKLSPTQRKFLTLYPECLTIRKTCERVGISTRAHFLSMQTSPAYAVCFESMKEFVIQAMEDEAVRRAYEGVKEDVFYQGNVCGEKQVYSDGLLMFMLKAARPDVYRERTSIDMQTPIDANANSDYAGLSKEALLQMREIAQRDLAKHKTITAVRE